MAFHGVFIGIDRYASPAIDWLGCAERDAIALHALFADNLGSGGELLTGDAATTAAIVERLQALEQVSEEDFVVITFSGHGSESHELVSYDTDASRLAHTALPLDRLAELFSLIPSKNLICVLDCCFSGGAGAKVLRVDGRKRSLASADSLLNQLGGQGRLILTASSATEPAWEKAQVGHGLLTYYLLEALQGAEEVRRSGKVSVLRLLEFVTTPPASGDVPALIRAMTEILAEQIAEAHPVVLSAWAHWAMTRIHPFRDGNGRIARLVQDYVRLRRHYLPVPLFAEDREGQYYHALEAADEGETRELVELISHMRGRPSRGGYESVRKPS